MAALPQQFFQEVAAGQDRFRGHRDRSIGDRTPSGLRIQRPVQPPGGPQGLQLAREFRQQVRIIAAQLDRRRLPAGLQDFLGVDQEF
ncbi:MAG: hypothetical protein LW700_16590 [Gemmataceae bacterium]|nr:hypothetical protein [Gemmataceae bacterium]